MQYFKFKQRLLTTLMVMLSSGLLLNATVMILSKTRIYAQTTTSSSNEADQLLQKGIQQNKTSQFHAALLSSERALQLYRQAGDRRGEANSLGSLGIAYTALGQYQRAMIVHKQALEIFLLLGDRRGEAQALGNLGNVYDALGQYPKAISFHKQYLQTSILLGDQQGKAQALGNLGNASYALGQYQKAVSFYQQFLQTSTLLGDRQNEAQALRNLGNASYALGQYQKAISFHQQSLEISILFGDRQGRAQALENLGNANYALGQYQKAVSFYQQSLQTSTLLGDQQGMAQASGNLGNAYSALGDYQKAISFHQESLEVSGKIEYQQGVAKSLGDLGDTYESLGQYQQALDYYRQSLNLSQSIGTRGLSGRLFGNVGRLLAEQKQPELAIVFLKQSVNLREGIRNEIKTLSREEQQSYKQTVADSYQRLATLLLDQNRVMEALLTLDLLKVQELQDFLSDVKGNQQTHGLQLLPQEQQILNGLKPNSKIDLSTYLQSAPVQTLVQQLEQTAAKQNLNLDAYQNLQISLSKLGQNSAFFYPLVTKGRLELVVFTQNAPPIHRRVKISEDELEQTVELFRTQMQSRSDDIKQTAQKLHSWLIEPIQTDLEQANIQTLIYAPDGQMRYVPLAALYDGKQWLVEQYKINYITALSLTDLDTQSFQTPSILAGAFTDDSGQVKVGNRSFDFGPIPAARKEIEALAQNFSKTQTLTGLDFNRKTLTSKKLNRHNIVHLATHGQLVSGNPEESFILLNNGEHISLREIKDWHLPNVGLVILSACQTALGDRLGSGIEIIGFGYQLQQAQARAAIATLWSIDDTTTSDLMNAFYKRLKEDSPNPVDALQKAQIDLITGGDGTSHNKERSSVDWQPGTGKTNQLISQALSHPYYWAPFILIGNGL